ncbi:GNAT family N-acetyltransferase [Sphingomonas sp.]|uniref:GNAT family N-acetyltransferase n=1 Tax=Sphingomonas sp. TaxID=28214 RepID=UPI0031DECB5C
MRIEPADPCDPAAAGLLDRLSDALEAITGDSGRASFDPLDVQGVGASFVLAYDDRGRPIGCGAYRPLVEGVAELKRMFALPGSKGVGAAVLAHLEARAQADGYRELWLETRLVNDRAVRFYHKNGYRRISNFGKYAGRPEAVCFAKILAEPVSRRA